VSLKDDVLPIIRDGWALVSTLGFAPYTVVVRTRTWSGGKVKLGTSTDSDLTLSSAQVKELGGDRELEVYAITPSHSGGGYTPAQLNPTTTAGVEYYYVVTGPNGTHNYTLASIDSGDPVEYKLRLAALTRGVPF
jgi:hypothetical protein